jgi:hypothetical protein
MNGLDIVVTLGSGVVAEDFYKRLFDIQSKKRPTRLIYFIPTTSESKNRDKYYRYAVRGLADGNIYERNPIFILGVNNFQEFVNNPSIRFLDDPKPENYLLLIDDFVANGTTLINSIKDIESLGYIKKKIFFYNYFLDKLYDFKDYSGSKFSESKFEKRLNETVLENVLTK